MMMQSAAVPVGPEPVMAPEKLEVGGHMSDEKKESPSEEEQAEYNLHHQQQQPQLMHPHYTHNPYAYPHLMAGMVPPQQVYIQQQQQPQHHHQLPLETRFQSLGLDNNNNNNQGGGAPSGTGQEGSSSNSSSNNEETERSNNENNNNQNENSSSNDGSDDANNEGGEQIANEEGGENESDEEPIKLFVGQVPKTMNEEDIFPTFNPFGPLKDVSIIRDKHTQLHRGCAFVTYWNASDAEQAQEALHGKHIFPGARRPAQVKPAEPSVPENKLFIGMLSRRAGEEEVRELFQPHGDIREIYMIRNADGTSKCAAFLRYVNRDSAIQAIENLHNNIVMEGAARPLIVKFADNKHQRQQRHMRNARRQELMVHPGGVYAGPYPGHHMPLPPPGSTPHQYPPHITGPPHHMPQYPGPYPGPGASGQMYPMGYPPPPYGGHPPYGAFGANGNATRQGGPRRHPGDPGMNQANNPRPREGPAGANLFVYHLPHDLTDADLATAFNPFGNVISAKVYVDRYTGDSKGFGFVSYDSVISAEQAIEQMNGFQIGNKRLKVQHKRVHNNGGGNRGAQQSPVMVPYDQQPQPGPQGILETSAPPDVGLDAGNSAPPAEGPQAPIGGGEGPGMMS